MDRARAESFYLSRTTDAMALQALKEGNIVAYRQEWKTFYEGKLFNKPECNVQVLVMLDLVCQRQAPAPKTVDAEPGILTIYHLYRLANHALPRLWHIEWLTPLLEAMVPANDIVGIDFH